MYKNRTARALFKTTQNNAGGQKHQLFTSGENIPFSVPYIRTIEKVILLQLL